MIWSRKTVQSTKENYETSTQYRIIRPLLRCLETSMQDRNSVTSFFFEDFDKSSNHQNFSLLFGDFNASSNHRICAVWRLQRRGSNHQTFSPFFGDFLVQVRISRISSTSSETSTQVRNTRTSLSLLETSTQDRITRISLFFVDFNAWSND